MKHVIGVNIFFVKTVCFAGKSCNYVDLARLNNIQIFHEKICCLTSLEFLHKQFTFNLYNYSTILMLKLITSPILLLC